MRCSCSATHKKSHHKPHMTIYHSWYYYSPLLILSALVVVENIWKEETLAKQLLLLCHCRPDWRMRLHFPPFDVLLLTLWTVVQQLGPPLWNVQKVFSNVPLIKRPNKYGLISTNSHAKCLFASHKQWNQHRSNRSWQWCQCASDSWWEKTAQWMI